MKEVGGHNELWLVKAGDQILGPYDNAEVTRKLLSREIAVIDEISKPMSRWRYVREEPAFFAIVEQIRNENMNSRDDTMATITATPTLTLTETQVDPLDLTPTPAPVIEVPSAPIPPTIPKSYGLEREVPELPTKSNAPIWLSILLIIAIGGFWLYKNRPSAIKYQAGEAFSFDGTKAKALNAIAAGEYREALTLLRETSQANSSDPDVQLALASMLLKVESQSAAARRIINDLQKLTTTDEQKKRAAILLSYADLADNEPTQALQKLAVYEKFETNNDKVATFNSAVALKQLGKSAEAEARLEKILSDSAYSAPARIILAILNLENSPSKALEVLKPLTSKNGLRPVAFQQEAFLLQSYIETKANQLQVAQKSISEVLSSDPYGTQAFSYDPALYLQNIHWSNFKPYCEFIESAHSKLVEAETLLAICELKGDRQARALELMTKSLAQAPQDHLLLANNAYLLLEFGKDEEAKGSLRMAMRNSDSELTLLLMARACGESGDAICERESYKKVLSSNSQHLTALVGLAELELKAGNAQTAMDYYNRALTLNPTFAPLLRLKEKLP